jgi:hypothetical protein
MYMRFGYQAGIRGIDPPFIKSRDYINMPAEKKPAPGFCGEEIMTPPTSPDYRIETDGITKTGDIGYHLISISGRIL